MAAPFDVRRLQIVGGAVGVVANVMQAANMTNEAYDSGAGQFAVSESGSLVYVPGGMFPDPERVMVWVNRSGATQTLAAPTRAYLSPRLSPDGKSVVVWTQGDRNVWTYDLSRNVLARVTSEARNSRPIWTPDGQRIAYASAVTGEENAFWKVADGSGAAERLTTSDNQTVPASWSPDGRTLVAVGFNNVTRIGEITMLAVAANQDQRALVRSAFSNTYPDVSQDGRWLAYASDEPGRQEVYVQPFPGPGARHQVSVDGGTAPAWSHDGKELFYMTAETTGGQANLTKMMAVPVKLGATFDAGTPHELFKGRFGGTALVRGYDVTSDGRRFLMVQQKDRPATVASNMILVENWFTELQQRVPTR